MELQMLLSAIEQADGCIIDEIIDALRRRYHTLFPDYEIIFLSLPRSDREERKRILELILKMEAASKEIATPVRTPVRNDRAGGG